MFKEGKDNINYKDGKTKMLKDKLENIDNCLLCGSEFYLLVHHLDGNHGNNVDENLKVMCHQCHDVIHQKGLNFHNKKWKIKTSEDFLSIQGEGVTCGTPSLFIRLFGCTTNCPWCDTNYSKGDNAYKEYNYKEIANLIICYAKKSSIRNLVITGGEPLEQSVQPLIMIAKLLGYRIEIETNGKPIADGNKFILPSFVDQFNISPKLWSKEKVRTFRKDRIKKLMQVNSIFKFVVKTSEDFRIVEEMIKRGVDKERVWLMPLTGDKDEKKTMGVVWDYCVKNKLKFSARIHYLLFGNKRNI